MTQTLATGPGSWDSLLAALYHRLPAAMTFTVCAALLGAAAWLTPDPTGHGTHTQLGLPACGFIAAFSLPCATCGMTTAFALAAEGHLLDAFLTQPAAALGALLAAILLILSAWALVRGLSLAPIFRYLVRPTLIWSVVALVIASWLYTIATYRGIL